MGAVLNLQRPWKIRESNGVMGVWVNMRVQIPDLLVPEPETGLDPHGYVWTRPLTLLYNTCSPRYQPLTYRGAW